MPKKSIVFDHAFQHLFGILVELEAERLAIKAGGRDREHQRLPARAGAGLDHIPRVACLVRVHLVDDRAMHVQAVERIRIRAQRLELRGCPLDVQIVLVNLDALAQAGRALDHAHGFGMCDARLIAFGRGAIDLGARLAIGR
jgi:hypothetical protein